jgi:hypothetical protein
MAEYPVWIRIPGVFSQEANDLRDQVADWLEEKQIQEDDYHSFYCREKGNQQGEGMAYRAVDYLHICYSFQDPKIATMFKLTFR